MSGYDDPSFTTTLPGDAAYTAVLADFFISFQGITAGRILTIPAAAAANKGRQLVVHKDAAAFAVTITPVSGNIDAGANVTLAASAIHSRVLMSDGVAWNSVANF